MTQHVGAHDIFILLSIHILLINWQFDLLKYQTDYIIFVSMFKTKTAYFFVPFNYHLFIYSIHIFFSMCLKQPSFLFSFNAIHSDFNLSPKSDVLYPASGCKFNSRPTTSCCTFLLSLSGPFPVTLHCKKRPLEPQKACFHVTITKKTKKKNVASKFAPVLLKRKKVQTALLHV